jgi:RNA-directed DNA polymerase
LERAWGDVRRNRGAAGIDHITLADVEEYGIDLLLADLRAELKARTFRPVAVRERMIPKPGSSKQRRLGIATVAA